MFDRKHAVETAFLQFDGLTERKIYYVILGHGWTKRLKSFFPKLKKKSLKTQKRLKKIHFLIKNLRI